MSYNPPYCDPTTFIFALLWYDGVAAPTPGRGNWRIHGLWPETCQECPNCGYPSYCRKVHFNQSSIQPLSGKIQERWYPDPGNDLIVHEWMKHGSCDGKVTEFDYFNTTLNLWDCIPFRQECSNAKEECKLLLSANQVYKCGNTIRIPPP